MSWVNDLAAVLGIPAGAATLAVTMYAGCSAAERTASAGALKDISRALKDSSWSRSVRPTAIIETVFGWTFGERHLSWKCLSRSVFATVIFAVAFSLAVYLTEGRYPLDKAPPIPVSENLEILASVILVAGVVPDFLALGKTRVLLSVAWPSVVLLPILDIALSLVISVIFFFLWYLLFFTWFYTRPIGFDAGFGIAAGMLISHLAWLVTPTPDGYAEYLPFLCSTLFTSIWTILILLSTAILRLLAPLQRFTSWFFDIEGHPLRAIGSVSGALVMIGSFIWTLLRGAI